MKLKNLILRWNKKARVYFKPTTASILFTTDGKPTAASVEADLLAMSTRQKAPHIDRIAKWLKEDPPRQMSQPDEPEFKFIERLLLHNYMNERDWVSVWYKMSDGTYHRDRTISVKKYRAQKAQRK